MASPIENCGFQTPGGRMAAALWLWGWNVGRGRDIVLPRSISSCHLHNVLPVRMFESRSNFPVTLLFLLVCPAAAHEPSPAHSQMAIWFTHDKYKIISGVTWANGINTTLSHIYTTTHGGLCNLIGPVEGLGISWWLAWYESYNYPSTI